MSSPKPRIPEDKKFSIAMYHFAVGCANLFNILIGRPRIIFESDKARFENLPDRLLIICNHTYWLDPPLLATIFRQRLVNPVAAKEVFEHGRGFLMRSLRCIPLDRTTMDVACIKECVARLKDNQRVVIFPEGQLNLTDEILPFKAGGALISLQSHASVVPVYTTGEYRPFGKLKIMVGEPVLFEEMFSASAGAAAIENANSLLQSRMQRLKNRLMTEMSDKDKKSMYQFRNKFIEKREEKAQN